MQRLLVAFAAILLLTGGQCAYNGGVETMHEKLVFSSAGCKVYQVTIRNEYGFDQLYVAVNPAASKRPTSAYPTCRITK